MVWLLFFRSAKWVDGLNYEQQLRMNINLQPFLTIRNYWNVIYHRTNDAVLVHCIINLGGNILLFIPIGVLLPRIYPKLRNFFRFFCLCLGVMFLVEVLQLFTLLGSFDVDDLILNLFGMVLGYIGYHLFRKKK
jgi:glycopeptide antibiotics resistance protein